MAHIADSAAPLLTASPSGRVLRAVLDKFEAQETDAPWEYDGIWDVFHAVLAEQNLAKKPLLMGPMRHAITGKTVCRRAERLDVR